MRHPCDTRVVLQATGGHLTSGRHTYAILPHARAALRVALVDPAQPPRLTQTQMLEAAAAASRRADEFLARAERAEQVLRLWRRVLQKALPLNDPALCDAARAKVVLYSMKLEGRGALLYEASAAAHEDAIRWYKRCSKPPPRPA